GDRSFGGIACFGHGGGAPGMNDDLEICPGPGYVVGVLANLDPPAAQRVSDFVLNRLPEKRSEEHTSELQSRGHLVCRLLLEKKKNTDRYYKFVQLNIIFLH